ncbi:venom acid phosphatase Acph-1-like isoform X2 [Sitophilus oryzae]|uniref:acid phosphatase n=1 Tax=Sitophilus oryzae TaxID=7048 RepID=A0A6J2YJ02_SITOR|nr:venom acid phosphatase Acph-1-like isoform X2 [Sitophilus oryzae]
MGASVVLQFWLAFSLLASLAHASYDTSTLKLVHVAGKVTEYNLGYELRNRFDSFLETSWNINYVDTRSTDVNRTKMSAELVLASLYPARLSQIWSSLFWLPIPYNYYPYTEDKEIYPWGACSTYWNSLVNSAMSSSNISTYFSTRYKKMITIMEAYTDITITAYSAYTLYFGFATQDELGLTLEDWTSLVYPEPLHSAAVDFYYINTNTTALRRISAGYLLKKILSDTADKINGTISPSTRKVFLYSAHELNVASMLLSLEVYNVTTIAPYGSYVLFELHEIDEVYGIKLFYQFYEEDDPVPVKLTGCDYFCPYDTFYSLVEDLLPESDSDCTGS